MNAAAAETPERPARDPAGERPAADRAPQALLAIVDALARELDPAREPRAELASSIERDLGIDSLARVELLLRIERGFGVHLPERTLAEAETVADLLAALRGAPRERTESAPRLAPIAAKSVEGGGPRQAETLAGALAWHVARHAGRVHIRLLGEGEDERTLTYGGLYEMAKRVAAALAPHDVARGSVAMMLPTGLEFFGCFLGAQLAGAVPVPLYPPARPSQLEDHMRRHAAILANCDARVLITVPAIKPLARLIQPQLPALAAVLAAEDLTRAAPGAAFARAGAADLALLQYTSGSTGNPKGVMLTHANVMANIRAWSERVELAPADVCVSWLPLYHDMGLIGTWMGSLYNAFPLVLMSPLSFLARPERWLWAIHRHRGTVTAAPNFAFELLLRRYDAAQLSGLDLSSWRLCANGAEPVSPDTIERFAERFAAHGFAARAMTPVYGLAESAVGLTVPRPGRGARVDRVERVALTRQGRAEPAAGTDPQPARFAVCGPPLPGHEVRIVDEAGRVLPERRVGRIEFRGPSATSGYFRNPEASAALSREGWLDTGDLGYLAEGELVPTSRVKDLIIRGGHNLYPYELEEAVGSLPGVRKGCVAIFGSRDPFAATERLVVVAETRLAGAPARAALAKAINERALALLGTPADEIVLARPHSVLKTSSGKIRRAATREAWEAGRLGAAGRPEWLQLARLAAGSAAGWSRRAGGEVAHTLYALYAWGVFGLLTAALLAVLLFTPSGAPSWRACRAAMRALLALGGVRVEVNGREHAASAAAAVFVANHASYLDGLIVTAVLAQPVVFVAKRELRRALPIRFVLDRLRARYVERFEVRASVADARGLADMVRAGERLFVFAEGTFVRAPGLRPFHLGGFAAAAAGGAPIVPVALSGTRSLWPAGSWRPWPAAVTVTFGAPIAPAGQDWGAAVQLRDAAREHIARWCGEPNLSPRA
jgi:1-acyl-sn-glycerol-3-phosphate acyltransferase